MRTSLFIVLLLPLLALSRPETALAQQGFALKAHYIFNSSAAEGARRDELPAADGYGIGIEAVLPGRIGIGVSGYTAGETSSFDVKTTELTILADVNYFFSLPLFPISPYAGLHAGLGLLGRENLTNPGFEVEDRTRNQIGYQIGLRFQPISLLGLDAQWRRMSTSSEQNQDSRLERNQVLIGITLF